MSDKYKKWFLEHVEIQADTRERENLHILTAFETFGVPYLIKKLDTADYAMLVDGVLYDKLLIERKSGLNELVSNITGKNRERFMREMDRAKDSGSRLILLVESGSYSEIFEGRYLSKTEEQSFIATMFTLNERYGVEVFFLHMIHTGRWIANRFYYHIREQLKERGA